MNINEISEELNKIVATGDVVVLPNDKAKFIAKCLIDKVLEDDVDNEGYSSEENEYHECPKRIKQDAISLSRSIHKEELERAYELAKGVRCFVVGVKKIDEPKTGLTIQEFTEAMDSGKTCVCGNGSHETNFYMEDGLLVRKYNDVAFWFTGVTSTELTKMYVRA